MDTQSPSLRSSEPVEPEAFSRRVADKLGAATEVRFGQVVVEVPRDRIADALRLLRGDPGLDCEYFTFLSAVDWQDDGFQVLVTVYSLRHRNTVIVSTRLPADDPRLPTLTTVYRGANWHERETAEMFGILFEGHPNLVKLYLPEDFEGHPLRKSFRLASRTYKLWPGAKEPEEAGGR